jgi:hypothetical protein
MPHLQLTLAGDRNRRVYAGMMAPIPIGAYLALESPLDSPCGGVHTMSGPASRHWHNNGLRSSCFNSPLPRQLEGLKRQPHIGSQLHIVTIMETTPSYTLPSNPLSEKIRLLQALEGAQNDVFKVLGLHDPNMERTLLLNAYADRLYEQGLKLEAINERITLKIEKLNEELVANEARMDAIEAMVASHGRLIDALVKKLLKTPSEAL